jgi:calcium-dependent protein kinase
METVIPVDVIKNMSSYIDSQNFKRTTLTLIASRIPEDQIKALRDTFSQFDKNGDGKLTAMELKAGISKIPGCTMTEDDVDNLMTVMDSNRNGFIDYTEFIAGCLQSHNYLQENHLKTAFAYYDKDSNGNISLDELKMCLQSEELTLPDTAIEKLMKEVDSNKDGIVSLIFTLKDAETEHYTLFIIILIYPNP